MFGLRYDDDEEDNGMYFQNPIEVIARMTLFEQIMKREIRAHSHEWAQWGASNDGCKFRKDWVTGGHVDDSTPSSTVPLSSSAPRSLVSEIISDAFNIPESRFADLVFIVNEGDPIFAHKVVVASWSRCLHVLIKTKSDRPDDDDTENGDGDITLLLFMEESSAVAGVFKDFIQFMYTESIELSLQNAWPLLELAAKYGVEDLLVVIITFLLKHVANCSIDPSLVLLMETSKKSSVTRTIVSSVMTRLHENLFIQDPEVIESFEVDLLCDVLRCSDVIAVSEFDIYQKLKPKLSALKQQGNHREILQLLSLLRFTQMRSSQLDEVNSSEYSDVIREHFPGRLELARWVRALFAEQSWNDLPINTERSRLYLERPIPYMEEEYRHYEDVTKTLSFDAPEVEDVTIDWKDGEQSGGDETHSSATLLLKAGEHGVTKLRHDLCLTIPTGSFPFLTVDIRRLGSKSGLDLIYKLIADCHITSPDLPDTDRRIATRILDNDDVDDRVTLRVNILPDIYELTDTCKMKVKFMCYACVRDEVNLGKWGFGWTATAQREFRDTHC